MNLPGQSAIVTGGGSGLGAQTARELARRGARVAVLDINGEAAAAVAAEIDGVAARCDITDTASVEAALALVQQRHGAARILMKIGLDGALRMAPR